MPNSMGSPGLSLAFYYGPEHQRVTQISSSQGTTYYLNPGNNGDLLFEKDIKPGNSTEQRNYITAYGQVVAMVKLTNGTTWTTRYLHRDNLGSVTAITNEAGAVVERLAYEPFGKRRFANGSNDTNNTIVPLNTDRGYTNHEHLDELTLIHMNGRVYDPVAGRFMSADPNIQDPLNLQSYNRYAYVMNNPLMYTDPSGYLSVFGIKITPRLVVAVAVSFYTAGAVNAWAMGVQGLTTVATTSTACTLSLNTAGGMLVGASAGFTGSMVMTNGDVSASLKGAATGAMFGGVNAAFGNANPFVQTAANGFAGGAAAKMQGGSFGDGFRSAALQHLMNSGYKELEKITDGFADKAGTDDTYDPNSKQRNTDGGIGCVGSGAACDNPADKMGMSSQGKGGHLYNQPGLGIVRTFVVAVSKIHDFGNSWNYGYVGGQFGYIGRGAIFNTAFDALWNFPSMPVAAALTVPSIDVYGVGFSQRIARH